MIARLKRITLYIIVLIINATVLFTACSNVTVSISGNTEQPDSENLTEKPQSLPTSPAQSPQADVTETRSPEIEPSVYPTESPEETPEPIKPTAEPEPTQDAQSALRVYLTFDDGPNKYTEDLLDILDQYGVKATFFTVGYFINRYPETVRDQVARGHLVCCHTFSHDMDTVYESAEAFMADVEQWSQAYEDAVGVPPSNNKLVRFPGGSKITWCSEELRNDIKLLLKENGWRYYDWTFGDNDRWLAGNKENLPKREYLFTSFEQTLNMAINNNKPLIFLAHDTDETSVSLIGSMIEEMLDMGCTFGTLDELETSYGF